ncbi:chalcone isomerase [Microthyrium microscopicum]|uniref:Chalcone isomerase n=1 Tax=Microthyrium microscopicum TaxID=703497 RepID=A0A6A6UCE7_9PEZI|nr:chalcone isomerase [Microthyrium microscopicum]
MAGAYAITTFMDPPQKNSEQQGGKDIMQEQSRAIRADSSREGEDKFQGKPVVVAAGGAKLLAHDEKTGEDLEVVPTGTSTIPHFPKTMNLPIPGAVNEEETEYTLVGLGVRTVSFLSIEVYVVGLYIQTSSLSALQAKFIKHINPLASSLIPGEKEKLRSTLLDPEESYRLWDEILKDTSGDVNSAFRIVPTKNTDFQHLRDGWVRGIKARTQAAGSKGNLEFTDEGFGSSMGEFNALFGRKGKAPKGSVLVLTRDGSGRLGVIYQDKSGATENFGTLEDERIARLIWLGYVGGKNVSSEDARKKIIDGVIHLVERPLGTAATQIT